MLWESSPKKVFRAVDEALVGEATLTRQSSAMPLLMGMPCQCLTLTGTARLLCVEQVSVDDFGLAVGSVEASPRVLCLFESSICI